MAYTLGYFVLAVFVLMAAAVVWISYKMGCNDGKEDKN